MISSSGCEPRNAGPGSPLLDPPPCAPPNGRPGFHAGFPFGFLGAGRRLPKARRGRAFDVQFTNSQSSPDPTTPHPAQLVSPTGGHSRTQFNLQVQLQENLTHGPRPLQPRAHRGRLAHESTPRPALPRLPLVREWLPVTTRATGGWCGPTLPSQYSDGKSIPTELLRMTVLRFASWSPSLRTSAHAASSGCRRRSRSPWRWIGGSTSPP